VPELVYHANMNRPHVGILKWFALVFIGLPLSGAWQGCELGTVTSDSTDQKPPVTHSAKLQITNQKLKNPGPMEFKLYPSSANNILQATVSYTVGTVGENETKTFSVPSGTWKVGYSTYGELFDMPDTDTSGAVWPKVQFSDSVSYTLRIFTNEIDNRTYWQNNFVFVP
jgi:hypothetical protein